MKEKITINWDNEKFKLDKDIEDLKVLIRLTMNWITSSMLTKKYLKELPE